MDNVTNPFISSLIDKGTLKKQVYLNTFKTFIELKQTVKEIYQEIKKEFGKQDTDLRIDFNNKGEFTTELTFAGDLLVAIMHTNIFQFPREHEVMNTSYIKEDPTRSYCGVIKIYNFLADSYIYNRLDDIGYLVARIYINKDFHYFVEGKRQVGLLYNNFANSVIDKQAIRKILETAISYCINFDLLTPPYDLTKEITVQDMQLITEAMRFKTGKRLGFRFQADLEEELRGE